MLNCSLHHQFHHHVHNYTDTAFKTPSRLRGLICIHALDNTCLSLLAANPLCLCFSSPPLCSHLSRPLSSLTLVCFLSFILKNTYWAIHFHNVFSSIWYPIKVSEGSVQNWIEEIDRKAACYCPSGVKPEVPPPLSSFFRDAWVEILLGTIETIGQTGALSNGCRRAIQAVYLDFKMGSPDIHRIFFLDLF